MADKDGADDGRKKSFVNNKNQDEVVEDDAVEVTTGTACFRFRNYDRYRGEFQATNDPRTVHRHGLGEYTSRDGHTYAGEWQDDVMHGNADISYPNGTRYSGQVADMTYDGPGSYTFADSAMLRCGFVDSKPDGDMELTGPDGREWKGVAEEFGATLIPTNHFLPTESCDPPDSLASVLLSSTDGVLYEGSSISLAEAGTVVGSTEAGNTAETEGEPSSDTEGGTGENTSSGTGSGTSFGTGGGSLLGTGSGTSFGTGGGTSLGPGGDSEEDSETYSGTSYDELSPRTSYESL